jgi:hypothetical protein
LEECADREDEPAEDVKMAREGKARGWKAALSLCEYRSLDQPYSSGRSAHIVRLIEWDDYSLRDGAAIRYDADDRHRVYLRNLSSERKLNPSRPLRELTVLIPNTGIQCAKYYIGGNSVGGTQRTDRWEVSSWILWVKSAVEIILRLGAVDDSGGRPGGPSVGEGDRDSEEENDDGLALKQAGGGFGAPLAPCQLCMRWAVSGLSGRTRKAGPMPESGGGSSRRSLSECPMCRVCAHPDCLKAVATLMEPDKKLVRRARRTKLPFFLPQTQLCELCARLPWKDGEGDGGGGGEGGGGDSKKKEKKKKEKKEGEQQEDGMRDDCWCWLRLFLFL